MQAAGKKRSRIASSPPSSSPTSSAQLRRRSSSAIELGGRCSSATMLLSDASSSVSAALSWTWPATGSSPASTAPRARCGVLPRSAKACVSSASRSVRASIQASARSWTARSAGSLCTSARVSPALATRAASAPASATKCRASCVALAVASSSGSRRWRWLTTTCTRHDPIDREMTFTVGADAYDRFMGRYSRPLAPLLVNFARVADGQRVLDVGCGPGALTAELVARLSAGVVTAVDPSEPFVAAVRARQPEVEVRLAAAEDLPFGDETFAAALAQLVVHFMADPIAGLREMARVTQRGGTVAACVWVHAGGGGPLALFWDAARELEPGVRGESELAGARRGHLAEL